MTPSPSSTSQCAWCYDRSTSYRMVWVTLTLPIRRSGIFGTITSLRYIPRPTCDRHYSNMPKHLRLHRWRQSPAKRVDNSGTDRHAATVGGAGGESPRRVVLSPASNGVRHWG